MLGSPRRRLPGSRQVRLAVAAFGKHPAWRDHIDEDVLIATPTDELKLLERWLHGAMFEEFTSKSAVNSLSAENLIALDHLIVRSGQTGCSLTRVWASTDYTGRAQFPMVLCVDAEGLGVDDALRRIAPPLEACATKLREIGDSLRARIDTEDPAHSGSVDAAALRRAVREAVEALRQQLAASFAAPADGGGDPDPVALLTELRAHADSGPDGQGLARVLYRLERLKPLDGGSRSMTRASSARRWRLPRAAESDDQSVRRWLAFLSFLAPDSSMITLALPRTHAWVDLFVGDVGVGELERLRLSERAESVESRTSYSSVDAAYVAGTKALMDGWARSGAPPAPTSGVFTAQSLPPRADAGNEQPSAGDAPTKKGLGRRWRDWLIGGGGVIALAALVGFLVSGRGAKPVAQAGESVVSPMAQPSHADPPHVTTVPPKVEDRPALTAEPATDVKPAPAPPPTPIAAVEPVPTPPTPPNPKPITTEPAPSRFRSEASAAKFTLVPVAAAWSASIAEAEKSAADPEEARKRLDLTRRGLEEIERALAFPADASEAPAAADAARRIWGPKAGVIASELAGTAVRDARAGTSLSRETAEKAAAELTVALRSARESGGAFAKAASALRAGQSLKLLAQSGLPERLNTAEPEWASVAAMIAGDATVILQGARELRDERNVDLLLEAASASAPVALGTVHTAWDRLEDLARELTPERIDRLPSAYRALVARIAASDATALDSARDRTRRIIGARLAAAPMDDRVAAACSRAVEALGSGSGDDAGLSGIAAANLALSRLKSAAPTENDTATLRAKAVALSKDHGIPIPLPEANPGVQKADPALFASVGPAAKGWKLEAVSPDLDRASFTRGKLRLEFLRVTSTPEIGGGAAYLCTTELSVAVMLDTLDRTSGWTEFGQLIALPGSDGEDPRAGIRTWQFGRRSLDHLEPATIEGHPDPKAWLQPTCTYAEGAVPPAPTPNSPAQYLPFAAAVHLAGVLGCRLPSSGEWLAAAQRIPDKTHGWNRRDTTWQRYAEWFTQHPCVAGSPVSEVFRSGPGIDVAPRVAIREDDGVLWLSDVESGPAAPFRHLIGNVAEWCFDQPGLLDARLTGADKRLRLAPKDVRVIGGSALSGPEVEPTTALPVAEGDMSSPLGFSDVGIRLAFSSPVGKAGTELHQIRQAIQAAAYRTAP